MAKPTTATYTLPVSGIRVSTTADFNKESVSEVIDAFISNPQKLNAFHKNPVASLKKIGVIVNKEDLARIRPEDISATMAGLGQSGGAGPKGAAASPIAWAIRVVVAIVIMTVPKPAK